MRSPLDRRSNWFGNGDYGLDRLSPVSNVFVEELVEEALHQATRSTKASIWRRRRRYVKALRKQQHRFETRLQRRWDPAFEVFDLCHLLSRQIGSEINTARVADAQARNDFVYWVLVRLHARACLVASEVRSLLFSGHASGAHARWRSIHEIAVVSSFIQDQGQDVAERYMNHHAIQVAKSARLYQEHCERLGQAPHEPEVMERLERERRQLIMRSGKPFDTEWGWAASALGVPKPTFTQLEPATSRDHFKPYYRMASFSIHPQIHSIHFSLGNSYPDEVLLAGPSNVGFTDPAHATLIAMLQITAGLGANYATENSAILLPILLDLTDLAGDAFLAIDQQIEQEEVEIRGKVPSADHDPTSESRSSNLDTD